MGSSKSMEKSRYTKRNINDELSYHTVKHYTSYCNTIYAIPNECIKTSAKKLLKSNEKKLSYRGKMDAITRLHEKYNMQRSILQPIRNIEPISSNCTLTHINTTINQKNLHIANYDELKIMQDQVDEAIKMHKIFTVNGNFYCIRNALVKRGWIEKLNGSYIPEGCDSATMKKMQFLSITDLIFGLKNKKLGHAYRLVILSKLVENESIYFYWDCHRGAYFNKVDKLRKAVVNRIARAPLNYISKEGLCKCSKQSHWCNNPGILYFKAPRTYSPNASVDELEEFKYDFEITAAISLLKWTHKCPILISESGKLPIWGFHFALEECEKFIKKLNHEDKDIIATYDERWLNFLVIFFKAVHEGNHFEPNAWESTVSMAEKSREMLKKLRKVYPYIQMDGHMNLWLLKPSFGTNGTGIRFCKTLHDALNAHHYNFYVIQKYIEQPLLIHNTKFDIRQWFLISSTKPLTIWMYKECYLRFSSQNYNLNNLHESVHLTNNSVQRKYTNGDRDQNLPDHNMWFLKDFQQYLINAGHPTVYDEIIYPGMKECITAAILAVQDQISKIGFAKGFALHGADFMLTVDFKPWLLEINSNPALCASTPVTSMLCPAVLEDVVKVVVDHAKDMRASTGNFQLIYKIKPV